MLQEGFGSGPRGRAANRSIKPAAVKYKPAARCVFGVLLPVEKGKKQTAGLLTNWAAAAGEEASSA